MLALKTGGKIIDFLERSSFATASLAKIYEIGNLLLFALAGHSAVWLARLVWDQ